MGKAEVLLVVARDRPDVYEAMRKEFADTRDGVEVVLDRRFGERRRYANGFSPERRRGERRRHDIEADLRSLGRAIIRRPR
jgi:hypothetical protein